MTDEVTWDDVDETPSLLERGPKPSENTTTYRPVDFQTLVLGNTQIAVLGAEGAYDAIQWFDKARDNPDVIVVVDGQIFVVTDAKTVNEAVDLALKAKKAKRKRTIKKGPEPSESHSRGPADDRPSESHRWKA